MADPHHPPRKRGAPYGNRNAVKHGLYSRHLRQADLSDQQVSLSVVLAREIQDIQDLIRTALERGAAAPDETFLWFNLSLLDAFRNAKCHMNHLDLFMLGGRVGRGSLSKIVKESERLVGSIPWETNPLNPDARSADLPTDHLEGDPQPASPGDQASASDPGIAGRGGCSSLNLVKQFDSSTPKLFNIRHYSLFIAIVPLHPDLFLMLFQEGIIPLSSVFTSTMAPSAVPIYQSTHLPVSQPANLSAYQSTNLLIYRFTDLLTYHPTNLPAYQFTIPRRSIRSSSNLAIQFNSSPLHLFIIRHYLFFIAIVPLHPDLFQPFIEERIMSFSSFLRNTFQHLT